MMRETRPHDRIRAKIEALGTSVNLPTVRKALGVLEGEHASQRRGGVDELMDIRPYVPGDEARRIDWRISARVGHPMMVQRERPSTSRVWLLLDVGREMTGSCQSGEHAYEVAANALRMFAALSLRRSDDVSLVFGDSAAITRVPFNGGFAQFGRTLDMALQRDWNHPRNIDALLEYARRIRDRHALIVLATDEHALGKRHVAEIRRIAQSHPMVVIDVATVNPFTTSAERTLDGMSNRAVPAFLRNAQTQREVDTHRTYLAASLEHELSRCGSRLIRSSSSEAMFDAFVRLVSDALARSTRNQLRAATVPILQVGG